LFSPSIATVVRPIRVVARHMHLVADHVGEEDLRIVHASPAGKTRQIEGHGDIDEIDEDERGHAESEPAPARKARVGGALDGGEVEAGVCDGHQCPLTSRLRKWLESWSMTTIVTNRRMKIAAAAS